MSHFAKVCDGKVIRVIVAEPEFFQTFVDDSPGEWIQTSYNTRGGKHYDPETGLEDDKPALRGNYAGPGMVYDRTNDVFYNQQPFPSWTLNNTTWTWEAPTPMPVAEGKIYTWDEATVSWVEVAE